MVVYSTIRQRSIWCHINWVLYLIVHNHPSRWGKYVFVLLYYYVHLLLLCRETPCRGFGGCSDLSFTFQSNNTEEISLDVRVHLYTLLHGDQRDRNIWYFLRYLVELISQSNNDTMGPRFINNVMLPHIWFSWKKITKFNGGNITQHLIFEWFDVLVQARLLVDVDISSLAKPTDGVWLRMQRHCQVKPIENIWWY